MIGGISMLTRTIKLGLCVWLVAGASVVAQQSAISRASQLEEQGRLKEAAACLTTALADKSLPTAERKSLEFDLDRLDRIKQDFTLTKDELFEELRKSVKDLTADEFNQWVKEGRFDSRTIDGQLFFMDRSEPNVWYRYPELAPRRLPPKDSSVLNLAFWKIDVQIKQAALEAKSRYVLPKRFHITMTVTAEAGAAPAGETIRAWLPIPREYPFQTGFELLSASPPVKHIDDPQSSIRSVYFEQRAQRDKATEFKIEYDYTMHAICFDPKPGNVRPCDANDPALQPFLREAPNVVFTPELRALSREIVGDETNPCLKARKCYDWIAEHIKYSYAIEYSTIRNISDYCRSRGYGDCGQEAMLFIALCRLNGVPARWQTGWHIFPGLKSIHDWSEIYLAPYGWMPVDPYMGIHAMQLSKSLTPEQRREVRDFYFGGLDQYRIIANDDHNQTLNPPKESMRSDNVDFQRGELEWGAHNIYFDKYSYQLTYKELEPTGRD